MRKPLLALAALAALAAALSLPAVPASAGTLPGVGATMTVHGQPAVTVDTTKGNGAGNTAKFTVAASAAYWQVNWSYNCHPSGSQGSFDYTVETPIGQDTTDYMTPNQLGWGYTAADRYYDHGTFYLSVNADQGCIWSLQVVVPPTPTYSVRLDHAWALEWSNGNNSTFPIQVEVTFTNHSTAPIPNEPNALTLAVEQWRGQPDAIADTYECQGYGNLTNAFESAAISGVLLNPGRSLTGCAVFAMPASLWTPHDGIRDGTVHLWWAPPGQKSYEWSFVEFEA